MSGIPPKFTRSVDSRSKARCEKEYPELLRDFSHNKTGRSVSSVLDWLVTAAAGISVKEEKLNMTMGLTDKQKSKIEELRKYEGALSNSYL